MKLKPKKFKFTKFGKRFLVSSWFMFWGGGATLFFKPIDWGKSEPWKAARATADMHATGKIDGALSLKLLAQYLLVDDNCYRVIENINGLHAMFEEFVMGWFFFFLAIFLFSITAFFVCLMDGSWSDFIEGNCGKTKKV